MRQRQGWLGRTACLLLMAGLAAQPALAFYPFGFFSPGGQGGDLIYVTWPFYVMDVNGDGDISGPDDGVPLNFETGPNGFTATQIQRFFNGFEEWERVGTAYAAFSRGPDFTEEVETEVSLTNIDGLNAVVLQTPTDPVIITGALGVTFNTFVLEPTTIVIDNQPVLFTEPQMIDCDVVVLQSTFEAFDQAALFAFESAGTILGGRMLGLGDATLTNFVSNTPNVQGFFVEQEVVTLRNFQGILEPRGVSSSMLNTAFVIDLGNSVFESAAHDLAPDDIAGITFLYPRQNSDLFFDINGYARTRSSAQIPSQPLAGVWIQAYVNANNTNNRVPIADTFTGLYTPPINPNARNRFELKNLFKQMETPGGITFQANYTLTCSEFRPVLDFDPANNIDTRANRDSTHGALGGTVVTGFGFDSGFLSEVFNESGNIVGAQNLSQGTPLAFDIVRREVVSTVSGQSLLQIVGPERLMFGDDGTGAIPTTGCPFNQIITAPATIAGGGPTTPSALRAFRDNVLTQSAVGVAITDAYYRVSPAIARLVYENAFASRVFTRGVAIGNWVLRYPALVLLIAGLLTLAAAARKHIRARGVIATAGLAIAIAALTPPAAALTMIQSLDEYVELSNYIVQGSIESAESHWTADGKGIVTDVTIRVEDSVKGRVNKGGLLSIQLPTGRVGAVVRTSPDLPDFSVGEDVVLFLSDAGRYGLKIVGGKRGKYSVKETAAGTKYVGVVSPPPNPHLRKAAAEIKAMREGKKPQAANDADSGDETADSDDAKANDGPITVEEFKDYIRYLDREQRKKRQ